MIFIAFFGGRLVCDRFVTVKGVAKRLWTWILWRMCSEEWQEKSRMMVASNQVKCLGYYKCFGVSLKVDTNWLLTESGN